MPVPQRSQEPESRSQEGLAHPPRLPGAREPFCGYEDPGSMDLKAEKRLPSRNLAAIFAGTETAALRICAVSPKISLLGNSLVIG